MWSLFLRGDRQRCSFEIRAGFHLDKNDQMSALRDDVDFAALHAVIAVENREQLRPQPERGQRFGAQAESARRAFGVAHLPESPLSRPAVSCSARA